jgi:hypothetical protein
MYQSSARSATAGLGKTFLAWFAVLSLLLSAFAIAAPAAATHDGGFDHQPLPIDTSTFAHDGDECEGVELEEGQVLLHWIANQQNVTEPIQLTLHLQGGESVELDSYKWNTPGNINSNVTHHFEVVLDGDVVITDLELSTNEGNVRLSHVCRAQEGEEPEDLGFLEIDKFQCPGEGETDFEIRGPIDPQSFGTQSAHECPAFAAEFDIFPAGSMEAYARVTTTGGTWTDEIPAGDYYIVEVATGAQSDVFTVGAGQLTIVIVTNFEGAVDVGEGNLKVVKFDCEGVGPEGNVRFELIDGDAAIPNPADCELGEATFRLNDAETGTLYTTVNGVLWLDNVPVGTHTLHEISPNQGSIEFTIAEAGEWVTIFVFNYEDELEEELGSITIQKEFEEGECPVCVTRTPGFWFNPGGGGGVNIANELLPGLNVTFPIGEGGADVNFTSVDAVNAYLEWDRSGGDGEMGLSGTGQLLRHYLALLLNVTYYECPADEVSYDGMTIAEWLAAAEAVLAEGGEDEAIKDALDAINNATIGDGTLECPADGTSVGLAGFTFELWMGETLLDSMTTDASGSVTFTDLELGVEYTIVETSPEGLECTIVSISNDGAVLNEDGTISVTLTEANPDITITVVNECEEVEIPEEAGLLEIDKILCPGEGDPLFEVIATGVPPTQFGIQSMHDECTTMDATFIVTPVGATEAWGEVSTEGGSVTFELPAGDYVLTEVETGAMSGTVTVVEGALTIVLVTNFEGEGELPGETANLKIVKWFCDGEEAEVRFEVLGGDVAIPNPANCVLGNATFALNDPDSETTFTTSGGVLWLTGLPLGTHTLYEVAPNEASVEFTLTTAGGWVTIFAFNIAAEGVEGQPGNGGQQPGEGQLPGQPRPGEGTLPDTAVPVTGAVPAGLLALVMLTGLGAAGYAMQAEARRRR